jgi:hypothetical protein
MERIIVSTLEEDFTLVAKCDLLPAVGKEFTFEFNDQQAAEPFYDYIQKRFDLVLGVDFSSMEQLKLPEFNFVIIHEEASFVLRSVKIQSINFGQLDFTNSELMTTDLTVKFKALSHLHE